MGQSEGERDDEDAEACGSVSAVEESAEKSERVPDGVAAVDDGRGRRHDDADEGRHREADGDGEELGPQRILGFPREAGEIRVVDDQGSEVGDGGHDSLDDGPAESASVLGGWLVHDRSDAVRADNGPDEKD